MQAYSTDHNNFLQQVMSIIEMVLWIGAFAFFCIEPFKARTAQGISVNFLLINLVGWSLLSCKNLYGILGEATYSEEVNWTDVVVSSGGVVGFTALFLIVKLLKSTGNKFTSYGIWVPSIGLVFVTIYLHIDNNLSNIMKVCGMTKSIIVLFSYLPQFDLISRNKTTKGWSMTSIGLILLASVFGILKSIVVYEHLQGEKSFLKDFDFGTVFDCLFTIFICMVFSFQFYAYKGARVHQNKYLVDLDTLKETFYQMNDPEPSMIRSVA